MGDSPTIGVNWLLLVYSTGILLEKFTLNRFVFGLLGASILVCIDILIEPIAVKYDYWTWSNGFFPLQNYLWWFLVPFCLFLIFFSLEFKKQNSATIVLLISQICFLMALNIWAS